MAGRSPAGVKPEEANVGITLPEGFDPSQPQKVVVVFSTDDKGGGHLKAMHRLGGITARNGWSPSPPPGPVLENNLSPEWHAAMIYAGLRAMEEKYPEAKSWRFFTGGNSGGGLRSAMMSCALLKKSYPAIRARNCPPASRGMRTGITTTSSSMRTFHGARCRKASRSSSRNTRDPPAPRAPTHFSPEWPSNATSASDSSTSLEIRWTCSCRSTGARSTKPSSGRSILLKRHPTCFGRPIAKKARTKEPALAHRASLASAPVCGAHDDTRPPSPRGRPVGPKARPPQVPRHAALEWLFAAPVSAPCAPPPARASSRNHARQNEIDD